MDILREKTPQRVSLCGCKATSQRKPFHPALRPGPQNAMEGHARVNISAESEATSEQPHEEFFEQTFKSSYRSEEKPLIEQTCLLACDVLIHKETFDLSPCAIKTAKTSDISVGKRG